MVTYAAEISHAYAYWVHIPQQGPLQMLGMFQESECVQPSNGLMITFEHCLNPWTQSKKDSNILCNILAEGAIALSVTLSGDALFAS